MKKEILKRFIQKVWNEGNISSIPDYIADKYTVIHDPGDPWDGMELDIAGFQNRVSISRAPVPDQRSGRKLYMSGATAYYFQNNRITGHWQIVDRLGVYRQLQNNQSHNA